MFQVFHTYVASVDMDVAYVLQWLQTCFPIVLDVCCKLFHLDIAKLDLVLHMLQMGPTTVAACCSC